MSTPELPREPARPDNEDPSLDPIAGSEAEFDLDYSAPPRSPLCPARRPPGAVRAFLFLTAAYIGGAIVGPALGVLLALGLRGERLPLRSREEAQAIIFGLSQQPLGIFCVGAVSLLLTLGVTLAFTRGWERRSVGSAGLAINGHAGSQFLAGLGLGAVLMGGVFAVEAALGWLWIADVAPLPGSLKHALFWLAILLPAAATEEVMLRGYTFQALQDQWGGAAATIITALIFGALHEHNPAAGWRSLVGIFVAGILFGTAVLVTGRLWLPIGLHVAWNLFEGPVLGFPVSGMQFPSDVTVHVSGPLLWTGGDFGPEAGLLGILASLAGTLILLAARRRSMMGGN